ncbi:MAG TPA: DinB family protein [Candidatus Agrococcus pullicola]|uniref:DinB family protein n=1 Tax=Candidatus Agrococcus pullicola TaxID=2838429 RepID=A0A9D1YSI4_9MICO|nr:DinB family protein [Candidatus Agrococcus pullicola]
MEEPRIDEEGRPEPLFSADERTTLLGFLDYQRATLEWKTRGLTSQQLRQSHAPSALTLAGLLGHLAWVEDFWFGVTVAGRTHVEPWRDLDWDADSDAEFTLANALEADDARDLWRANVETSRAIVDDQLSEHGDAALGLEHDAWGGREQLSLRWVLVHMIEEYARHNGHADLLREAIDGSVGE